MWLSSSLRCAPAVTLAFAASGAVVQMPSPYGAPVSLETANRAAAAATAG